ncbi:hypothetical protein ACG95N_00430 [Acinetobacter guillouiae]|uniref:hypothetical protein n=1 Tax=Acinetobacter guillouiae TaxID=106649 RepID=UPI003AF483CD
MNNWLDNNWNDILQKYPESRPLLSYFLDFFGSITGVSSFVDTLKSAVYVEGDSNPVSYYIFLDEVLDNEYVVSAVEFYFNGELDGIVPINIFVEVLEVIALVYIEYYPKDRDEIINILPKLRQAYSI